MSLAADAGSIAENSLLASLRGADGAGVRIAVIDSGVESDHPALAPVHPALAGRAIGKFAAVIDDAGFRRVIPDNASDASGHGTAVAAILRAHAPAAQLDSIRVIGPAGGSSHLVIAAMHWAIERNYHVINCSFSTPDADFIIDYKTVVDRAFCRNVAIVSACNNYDYGRVEYPGSFPTVISTDFGALPGLRLLRRPGQLVEFVARGDKVTVAHLGGTYRVMTGSSVAAPHVSALVARIRQLYPTWNACQIKSALYDLATTAAQVDAGHVNALPADALGNDAASAAKQPSH